MWGCTALIFRLVCRVGSFTTDATKYPTAVTAAPIHNAIFVALLRKFLLHLNWTTIFFLCDDKRDVGYYRVNCENSKRQLVAPIFKSHFITFDSGREPVSYDGFLGSVRKAARGGLNSSMDEKQVKCRFSIETYHTVLCLSSHLLIMRQWNRQKISGLSFILDTQHFTTFRSKCLRSWFLR